MTAPQGLAFSRETFAALSPHRFLRACLASHPSVRPNGRRQDEFRRPVINTDSLTYSNGSAVVRNGDTAVVCGIRAEILLASDIPHPPKDEAGGDNNNKIERLGLVVPNLELSTGCSQSHLPGNPPSSIAQALSWRLYTLLHASEMLRLDDLCIGYTPPLTNADDTEQATVTKAYWTLYLDILCISFDGACLDTAWIAMIAALKNTRLPQARWDADREMILCSPDVSNATRLRLNEMPIVSTFAVLSTSPLLKRSTEEEGWVLADPDSFEEDVCQEVITISTVQNSILKIERGGGQSVGPHQLRHCIDLAARRWQEVMDILGK